VLSVAWGTKYIVSKTPKALFSVAKGDCASLTKPPKVQSLKDVSKQQNCVYFKLVELQACSARFSATSVISSRYK